MEAIPSMQAFFYAPFNTEDKLMFQRIDPNKVIEQIRDSQNDRYALKHYAESGARLQGICQCDQFRDGILIAGGYPEKPNTFTTEGMAYILNVIFWTTAQTAGLKWYVFVYEDNVTPAVGNTAAVHLGAAGTYNEGQDAEYDNPATNRPAYTTVTTATAACTNAASPAAFTMASGLNVYGAGLTNTAAKTDATGVLMCAKLFSAVRAVIDNDVLSVTYVITLSNP